MNESEEYSDWGPVPSGSIGQVKPETNTGPFDQSLPGEFVRLALILTVVPLAFWFLSELFVVRNGLLSLIATMILLASLVSSVGIAGVRIGLLVLMSLNVLSVVVNSEYAVFYGEDKPSQTPNCVLLGCLCISLLFETSHYLSGFSRRSLFKLAVWGVFAIPAVIYVFGVPVFQLFTDFIYQNEINFTLRDPDWKFWNEVSFRASQFAIFSLFAYMGACIGSFLNVVAYCIPKGEPIGLRDSECPKCHTQISRIDNLPIFSYLNLGARCRTCKVHIPVRYLIAELVVAFIFGSLFLYELITGCANVPSVFIRYKGILWIILYPKWPAIAIYFFHACFMSCLLVLSIFELDRQPLKLKFAIFILASFVTSALLYWPVQPVSATDHLPFELAGSPLVAQCLKLLAGGLVGVLAGFAFGLFDEFSRSVHFRFGFALAGLVLGWQAIIQVAVVFVMLRAVAKIVTARGETLDLLPTSILLAAIMVHHPFWKTISAWWI